MDTKRAHAMNDWTDKINVKDGDNIHGMENNSHTKEAEPSKARHGDRYQTLTSCKSITDGKVELGGP